MYYCQWTGRVFNTFLLSLAASLDAGSFYGLLSPVTVLLSVMAFYFCLGALVPGGSVRDKMVFVLLLQAAMLSVLPALNETFYWLSGMSYTWATVVALFALALASERLTRSKSVIPRPNPNAALYSTCR